MAKDITLEAQIRRYVLRQFSDGLIEHVRVELGHSTDGDDIVNVTVIFGQPPQAIKIGNLTRSLWAELANSECAPFPIFSFMTSEEDARLREAA